MKKIYVVNGSEDGILAVTTNMRLAYDASTKYLVNEKGCSILKQSDDGSFKKVAPTYRNFINGLNDDWIQTIDSEGRVSVRTEVFKLNDINNL